VILLGNVGDEDMWPCATVGWWQDAEEDGVDYMGSDAGFVDHTFNHYWPGRSFGNPKYFSEGRQPTHWMPLPEPPK
jgi:hypothetical protein